MVVHDLHVVRATLAPAETDAPLLVDPDAVLSLPVAAKRFQAITRGRSQLVQIRGRIKHPEFSRGNPLDLPWELPGIFTPIEAACPGAPECSNPRSLSDLG